MIKITEEGVAQLMAGGASQEDIDNAIATFDPAQKYHFSWDTEDKIIFRNISMSELADYLISKYRICLILDALHRYDNGISTYLSDDDLDRLVIDK